MLNENLLDKTSIRIARLTNEINAFKKYDEERKLYYSKVLVKLGEAEELLDSIEDPNPLAKLKNLIDAKNAKIRGLKHTSTVELNKKNKEITDLKLQIALLRRNME